jgi:hypothetical protein
MTLGLDVKVKGQGKERRKDRGEGGKKTVVCEDFYRT